jgi:hypothetical protein
LKRFQTFKSPKTRCHERSLHHHVAGTSAHPFSYTSLQSIISMAEAAGIKPPSTRTTTTTMEQAATAAVRNGAAVAHVPFTSEAELQAMSNQCNRLIASVAPELAAAAELARRVNASITSELSTKAATATAATSSDIVNSNSSSTGQGVVVTADAAGATTTPAAAALQVQAVVTQSSTGGFSNVNHVEAPGF